MTAPPACRLCAAEVVAPPLATVSGRYRHCGTCDLIFQDQAELPDPAAERAHYLTHDNRIDDPRYRGFLAQLADPLVARLAPGAKGLDYGAGPGPALAAMLAERGFPTVIYDPFFAPDTGVLTGHYDFVTATEVVEHMHEPATGLDALLARVAPGGWLGLMTEFHPGAGAFPSWYYHRDPTHVSFYSVSTLRWIADRYGCGLEIIGRRVALLRVPGP